MVDLIQQPILAKRFPSRLSGSTLERLSDYFKAEAGNDSIAPPRRKLSACTIPTTPPQSNPAAQAWDLLEQATYGKQRTNRPDLSQPQGGNDSFTFTVDAQADTSAARDVDHQNPLLLSNTQEEPVSPSSRYSPPMPSSPHSHTSPRDRRLLHHQAQTLWQSLPQVTRHPTDRSQLTELSIALEEALQTIHSPQTITMPPKLVAHLDSDKSKTHLADVLDEIRKWNAKEQIIQEVEVWEKVLLEMCRQVHVQCADRGALLYRATARYKDIMQDAFGACAGLKANMVEMAERLGTVASQVADERKARLMLQKRLTYQQMVTDQLQQRLKQKETELEELSSKLRRGRFDILEDELKKYKAALDTQTGEFMQNLREMMEAEYQQKLSKALYGV